MKTFTTYAEKKAKQILNLLQGYTKGIRITAILILLLMGVSNAWAYNEYNKRYLYFDGSAFTAFFSDNCKPYISPKWDYNGTDGNNNGGDKQMTQINSSYYYYLDLSNSSSSYTSFRGFYIGRSANFYDGAQMGYIDGSTDNCIKATGWGTYSWSKYAPPMESASITNTSTVYGGDGTQGNPYQIKKGTTISVSATATSTVTADNQTKYYKFYKKENSGSRTIVGSESTTTTSSFTASSTVGTKYAVDVEARNEYYGTYGEKATSSTLYFITIEPIYAILGSFNNWAHSANTWDLSDQGSNNWKATFHLDKGSHTFIVVYNSSYYGKNNTTITRASATASSLSTSGENINLTTDIAGDYTFTFNSSNNNLSVTYPEAYTVTYSRTPTAAADAPTTDPSITSGNYVAAGTNVTFTAKAAKTGYTFKGWYDNNTGAGDALSTNLAYPRTINANTTIYAVYIENEYKVVAIANPATYGTITPGTATTMSELGGGNITATAKNGYKFDNWTIKSGTGYFGEIGTNTTSTTANTKFRPTADSEVQANFSAITYTIIYNLNGGTNDADNPEVYTVETPTITLKDPTRTGYSFAGWYTTNNFSGDPVTEITQGSTGDKTFYAKWIEQKEIYLVGEFGWDNPTEEYKFKAHPTKPGVYTLTKHFNKRDCYDMTDPYGPGQPEYEFKLQVNGTKYTVKTENGKKILQYTRQSKTKVLSDGTNYNSDPYYNLLLQADISGDYVFEYNVESQELTVEHPAYLPEASFIVGDFSDGQTGTDVLPKDGGAGHDWTEEHGIKFNGNTAKICFNGTGKTWEFKIKINGVWYGAKDLVITGDGTYTLTDDYAFQSETNCAIQTSGVNGCYTFTYTDNGDGTINLTVGFPKQSENPTTVYLKPNDEWKAESPFSITYSEETIEMEALDCNGEYYVVEIPAGIPEFQFKNKSGATTLPLSVPSDNKVLYDMTSTNITHIYLKPNSNWLQSGAKFEAYFWNNNGNDWVTMEHIGNNIYRSEKKRNNVLFNRIDPSNGYNKWSRTKDLVVPSNGTNLFEIDKNASTEYEKLADGKWYTLWDNSKWTTYTEPTYDVTINITGKGSIVINGQTYEGTSEGKTTLKIEDVVVNTAFNINSITAAERWDYTSNGTIKIASNGQEPLKVEGSYEICGPTTINLEFIQKYCLVTFLPNPPRGLVYPEQINSQVVVKGKKAVQPTIVELEGYLFAGWYPNGSTYTDANKFDFDTPIEQDIELCARWVPYEQCIFFKNNLNWDNIYVYTFSNNVWHNGTDQENPNDDMGVQPKVNHIEHGKMTRIGFTDVYYYALTNITTGFNYIAFSDQSQPDNNFLSKCNAIYRGDRQDHMQLFIPQRDQEPKYTNSTPYYSEGIWMKYNSTESGYKWSSDKNGWSTDTNPFTAPDKGGYSFSTKVSLQGGTEYKFKVNNINKDWYGKIHTMTKENCTNLWLEHRMEEKYNTTIQPNVTGEYIFTIYLGDGKVMISLEYPLDINDYRLAYNDNTTGFHPGHYIRKRLAEEQLDTVSFFVHKDYSPKLLLQKCTAIDAAKGTAKWETVGEAYPIDVNSTSVYNFVLQQTGTTDATHQATVLMDKTHLYTGNFYIRTDKAPGGWDYFRQEDNMIHFSSYASDHEHFTHYFCKWIESSEQKGYSNVKYTIANDYSYCISDTLDNDDVIKNNQTEQGFLPANANVRFTWNNKDNTLSRAYISGSTWTRDRFLVLSGNDQLFDINIDDETGAPLFFPEGTTNGSRDGLHANEAIFADMGNWIYQLDVHANNLTTIKLTALYNEVVQYFKGSEKESTTLLRSTAGKNYKIRLIYDFKINKLISAWLAGDETIAGQDQTLGADMMIIRHNQEKAEQLNFDPTSRQLTDVRTAYAVMTFDKYFLNNRAEDGSHLSDADKQSPYARALYWISFPFDVKLSEVFGFGEYGDYWIMEYYDGEARAINGLWADTDTYWKYITNKNYILQKGQGYVISLNLNKMGYESNIFDNTDEVSLYFPSNGALGTITGVPTNYYAKEHECTIDRENGIHKIYDSHWNVIGVPGFADIENVEIGDHLFTQDSIHFYYEYLPQTNEYRTRRAGNEKTPANFQTMYSYMVQYYGGINWSTKTFTGPSAIAARRTGAMPSQYDLRLELTTDDQLHDQTFLLLDEDKRATAEYDVNLDLTKIMNKNASIYTLAGEQRITLSGNTLPIEKATVPVGVRVDAAGEYTFRMPDGTDGIAVTLVDNATGTHTNMLMSEYTVTLNAGTIENRFYLVVDPDRTATSLENIGEDAKGDKAKGVEKFLIDGKLFIRTTDGIFDAKGQRL